MSVCETTVKSLVDACAAVSMACGEEPHSPAMAAAIQKCRDAQNEFIRAMTNPHIMAELRRERPCKFSREDRDEMRRMYYTDSTQKEIAERFGTTQAYVSKLLRK